MSALCTLACAKQRQSVKTEVMWTSKYGAGDYVYSEQNTVNCMGTQAMYQLQRRSQKKNRGFLKSHDRGHMVYNNSDIL